MKSQITEVMNKNFKKWKAEEVFGHGFIRIKVRGSISLNQIVALSQLAPSQAYGDYVEFYTMGFWEALFTKSGTWKTKTIP